MNKMSKRIAASVVSTLIAVSMIQTATAGEQTKKHHSAATSSERVRNANAQAAPSSYVNLYDSARFPDEALSAPAGRCFLNEPTINRTADVDFPARQIRLAPLGALASTPSRISRRSHFGMELYFHENSLMAESVELRVAITPDLVG
jgi:hypothetical protein